MRQREKPRIRDFDKVIVKVIPGCDSVRYVGIWNDRYYAAAASASRSL